MSKQCKFKVGKYNCGSYAFNLYKEQIDQSEYCDRHYWQDQAQKARADEREACAKVCETAEVPIDISIWQGTKKSLSAATAMGLANAIRARGQA